MFDPAKAFRFLFSALFRAKNLPIYIQKILFFKTVTISVLTK